MKKIAILLLSISLLLSCNKRRSSSEDEKIKEQEQQAQKAVSGEEFKVERGDKVSSAVEAKRSAHAEQIKPWNHQAKNNDGYFLVAASSMPNSHGGDMLRRINLTGTNAVEFDFNREEEGTQGALIFIPDDMLSAVPSKLIDSDGLFKGTICGLIPGPRDKVIALAGRVAFVLDATEKKAAFEPIEVISYPYGSDICRGVYVPEWKKLYAVDVSHTSNTGGQKGIFVADIGEKSIQKSKYFATPVKYGLNSYSVNNFTSIDFYDNELFALSANARIDAKWDTAIHRVPLNEVGEPLFAKAKITQCHNPIERMGSCPISRSNIGDIHVDTHSGSALLYTSGSAGVQVWDIKNDSLARRDMNPNKPGKQMLSTRKNGIGAVRILTSPDGKNIVILPHCKSSRKLKLQSKRPVFAFAATRINAKAPEKEVTPLDAAYTDFIDNLGNVSYVPIFNGTLRDFAVGNRVTGVIGAAAANLSGLGAGGDLTLIDNKTGKTLTFKKVTNKREAHRERYGFEFASKDPNFNGSQQTSHAIIWLP